MSKKRGKKPVKHKNRAQSPRKATDPGLSRLLNDLPMLACEPELGVSFFNPGDLEGARQEDDLPPDTIGRLADSAFHARLLVGLNGLKNRAIDEDNEKLRFQVDAARYYVEAYQGPAWDNPLVVALYYRDVARLGNASFSTEDALALVARYELLYEERLREKFKAFELVRASSATRG